MKKKQRLESLCPDCIKIGRKKKNIGHLVEINGKYGPFLGCSRYPVCKFTENWKKWIHIK